MSKFAKSSSLAAIGFALCVSANAKEIPATQGISFSEPVLNQAKLVLTFGVSDDPKRDRPRWHGGIDLSADWAAPVHAPSHGEVVYAANKAGYGQTVDLQVSEGWVIRMAHMSAIHVEIGDHVEAGHVLGEVGSTGRNVGAHLHLETRFEDKQYNPELVEGLRFYATEKSGD